MSNVFYNIVFIFISFIVFCDCLNPEAEKWYESARELLNRKLSHLHSDEAPLDVARNVIIFVGDGMGMSTITAARILKGQRKGFSGEETKLVWDDFPSVALAQTYNADAQVGESSACATALWCGIKANYETIGLDSSSKFANCASSFNSRVSSILTWAQEQGKATGIVTTTRISHATPAALYAHSPSRYWEDDAKVPPLTRRRCKDITRQLVEDEPGKNINVLLGGGRRHWFSMATHDPEHPELEGRRLDGRNLITEWLRNKKENQIDAEYVWNKQQFEELDINKIDHLLGLFSYSHMDFDTDRNNMTEPSIAEMTKTALKILNKNPWGYILIVEGGRIDHGHHYNNAFRALDETLALEEAVKTVLQEVDLRETLVIVTADHSNVMTFGGHGTKKGNPIFEYDTKPSDIDDLPYTTILYGNGPGYGVTKQDGISSSKNKIQAAAVPRIWATHGGEDVPVYAIGPLSNLFTGSFDQTYIPHAVSYISCLDYFKERCGCLYFNCETEKSNELNHMSKEINQVNDSCINGVCRDVEYDSLVNENHIVAQMRLVSYYNNTNRLSYSQIMIFCIVIFLIKCF